MLANLKRRYWRLLNDRQKRRNPPSISLSPHAWMDGIARHVAASERVVMIDGGAHDGRTALQFRERFPNLEVHSFEPNGDLFPALEKNLAGVGGTRNKLALAARTQTLEFIVNDSPMTSSVLPRAEPSVQYFDRATRAREVRRIEAVSLDEWCEKRGVERCDVLKLDLQGYELEALRGASRLLRRGVRCVFAEVNFIPFYEGSALFSDLDLLLRDHGYRLYNLYNICTHLPQGHIGSGDALWVHEGIAQAQPALREAA